MTEMQPTLSDTAPPREERPPPRAAPPVTRGRRVRRVLAIGACIALLPATVSYAQAMLRRSDSGIGVRTVEWLRSAGGAGLVSSIENFYYSLTAPSKGGPTLRALPKVGTGHGTARFEPAAAYRPQRVRPLISPALPGEGEWSAPRPGLGRNPPILVTVFRDEPSYPREVAGLAWIDTHRTTITLNPGLLEPAVTLPRGAMEVPDTLRGRLLATFNSAFKLSDDHSGFVLHGHTYAPLRYGQATFVRYRDGRYNIVSWAHGPTAPSDVVFARQNLPLIVDHGQPNPNLNDGPQWGVTVSNAQLVWRSAIGIDRYGNLLYFAGNYQDLHATAAALIRAGAVRAMELDINSYWVSFITYNTFGAIGARNLLSDMARPATRYLTPDDRDFFAVYLKSPRSARSTGVTGAS